MKSILKGLMMKKILLLSLLLLFAACTKISEPVSEGFIDNKKPEAQRGTSFFEYFKSKISFELTGTSKEVYLYYSTYEGKILRSANQSLPWSTSYFSSTDTLYYINVTNLNDSGYVQLKIYKDDVLIKTRSMEGYEANIRETGPTK